MIVLAVISAFGAGVCAGWLWRDGSSWVSHHKITGGTEGGIVAGDPVVKGGDVRWDRGVG